MSKIFSRDLFWLLIILLWNLLVDSKSVDTQEYKQISVPLSPYGGTSFDYDFDPDSPLHDTYRQNSNSFMEYWQNMVRNVRLPFINWNLTYPLANILNSEGESPPVQRRQKSKRKRKHSKRKHGKKSQKEKQSNENNEQAQRQEEQQMLQMQQYPTSGMDDYESFFYDPETDGYYKVTRVYRGAGGYGPEHQLTGIYAEPQIIPESLDYDNPMPIDIPSGVVVDEGGKEHEMNSEAGGRMVDWKESEISVPSSKNVEQQERPVFPIINEQTLKAIWGHYPLDNHFNPRKERTKLRRRVKSGEKDRPRKHQ